MAETVTPYLSLADFTAMYGPLSAPQQALATRLLRAAKIWIDREINKAGKDPLPSDDDMAILVSFEVVRDALPGIMPDGTPLAPRQTGYTVQTDDRQEQGTLSAMAGLLDFTDHHRNLLGLTTSATPIGAGFDSGFPEEHAEVLVGYPGNWW